MATGSLHIDTQADHVISLAKQKQPVEAVAERIWNSLDAEAMNVQVELERHTQLEGIVAVTIADDGHGVAPEEIRLSFERLGDSAKKTQRTSANIKRLMDGRHGRGRLRGFALGRSIAWTTSAKDAPGEWRRSCVAGSVTSPTHFTTDNLPISAGTVFKSVNPPETISRLTSDSALPRLNSIFASFLTEHPEVSVTFDGTRLDAQGRT